jgi:hypothetical protein
MQPHILVFADGIIDAICFCGREWAITTLHTYVAQH